MSDKAEAAARHLFLIFDGKHSNACHSCSESPSKLLRCKACKSAVYCGQECQVNHWNQGGHKHICKVLIEGRTKEGKSGRESDEDDENEKKEKKRLKKAMSKKKHLIAEAKEKVASGEFLEEEDDDMPNLDPETQARLELIREARRKRKQEEMEQIQDEEVTRAILDEDRVESELKRRDVDYQMTLERIGDPGATVVLTIIRIPEAIARFAAIASLEDVARWSAVSRAWNQTFAQNDLFWYYFLFSHGHQNVVGNIFNTNVRYRAIAFQTLAPASGWWRRDNIRASEQRVYEMLGIIRQSQGGAEVLLNTYTPIDLVSTAMTSRSFNRWIGSDQRLWRRIDARNRNYLDDKGDDLFSSESEDGQPVDYRASVLSYPVPGGQLGSYQFQIVIYVDENIIPNWNHDNKARHKWREPYGTDRWELPITWADFARHRTLGGIVDHYAPDSFKRAIDENWNDLVEANYDLTECAWYFEQGEPDSNGGEFPWPDGDVIDNEFDEWKGTIYEKLAGAQRLIIHCTQHTWMIDMDIIWPKDLIAEKYEKMSVDDSFAFISPYDLERMTEEEKSKFRSGSAVRIEIFDADGRDFYEAMEKNWPKSWEYQGMPIFQSHEDWEVLVVCSNKDGLLETTVGHIIPGLDIWKDNKKILKAAIQSQIEEIDQSGGYVLLKDLSDHNSNLNVTFTIRRK